jgi:hypothetical protein
MRPSEGAEKSGSAICSDWSELNAAEFERVCTGPEEGHRSAYARFAERIDARVRSLDQPLLNRAGAEVLDATR